MGINVPRVTVSAKVDKHSPLGELNLLSVGYGLHQGWMFATMFGAASVFGERPILIGAQGATVTLQYLVSIVVYVALLLAIAANDQRLVEPLRKDSTRWAAGATACLGTALLALAAHYDATPLLVVAGVLTAAGSSTLIALWGVAFSCHDSATIVMNTAVAVTVGMLAYVVPLYLLAPPASGLVVATYPLIEALVLGRCAPRPYRGRLDVPTFSPLPVNRVKFLVRLSVPVLIMGLALGVMRQMTLQVTMTGASAGDQLLLLLASGGATVLILVTLAAQGKSDGWNRLFRPLIPFIVVLLLIVPFRGRLVTLNVFATMLAYLTFEALTWAFFGSVVQRFRLSPVMVFCLGRGMLAAGVCVGSFAPVVFDGLAEDGSQTQLALIAATLVCLVVAYALLPREHEIEKIAIPCPAVRAVSARIDNDLFPWPPAGPEAAGDADAAPADVPEAAGPGDDGDGDAAEAGPDADEPSSPPDARKARRADESQAARLAMYRHPANARLANMSLQPAAEAEGQRARGGRFRRKCEAVANTYLLSQRETEVLFFLAKGLNSAYIQEKLYISEGTAKTHIRHIYRKLDIHSQQDLMRLVEDTVVDEERP